MKSQTNQFDYPVRTATRPGLGPRSLRGAPLLVLDRLLLWIERSQSRRQLLKLDERQLHDIGVTRADALREFQKPFWHP